MMLKTLLVIEPYRNQHVKHVTFTAKRPDPGRSTADTPQAPCNLSTILGGDAKSIGISWESKVTTGYYWQIHGNLMGTSGDS